MKSFLQRLLDTINYLEDKICLENNLQREELWSHLLYHSK